MKRKLEGRTHTGRSPFGFAQAERRGRRKMKEYKPEQGPTGGLKRSVVYWGEIQGEPK